MNKSFRILLLLLLLHLSAAAQQTALPVYLIKTDSLRYTKLGRAYWQLLADPAGDFTFEQVQKKRFRAPSGDSLAINKEQGKQVYWLRYQVRNTLAHPVKLMFSAPMSRVDVYAGDSTGHWDKKTAGNNVPWSLRSGQRQFNQIGINIAGGQTLRIYERKEFSAIADRMVFAADLEAGDQPVQRLENYYEKQLRDTNFQAFEGGVLLLAALITLFFYFVNREKVYLYFSLFALAYASVAFCATILLALFREQPEIQQWAELLLWLLNLYFLWHFLALFYRLPQYFPRWYRLNTLLNYIVTLSLLLWYSDVVFFSGILALMMRITLVLFFFSATLSLFWGIFRKGEGRRKRLITALPFLFMCVSYLLGVLLLAKLHASDALIDTIDKWAQWTISVCFLWMIVSFLWNLIGRFQHLQKQVLRETLARERLERENEQERMALMATQQAELETQVEQRTAELKRSIAELKTTQSQLIQSEKMASLGELTAGIAHEIQNPLNFVNNFSEVSVEMADELNAELGNGDIAEAKAIATEIKLNLDKIHHHGKRADNIVKGMLEHSRASFGKKEPADLNKLVSEYQRLAYHGLRAKDKSFNCDLAGHFGENLPQVNLVSQDIGRVLLNLLNNAFYAVNEKAKTAGAAYQPLVEVRTAQKEGQVHISVEDNGDGIPDHLREKIMQPFFTTKPTGQGTGLGLSLSYDIVVKGHSGAIDITSTPGEGTTMTISLPL